MTSSKVPLELSPLGKHADPSTTSLPPPYADADALAAGAGAGAAAGTSSAASYRPPPPPQRTGYVAGGASASSPPHTHEPEAETRRRTDALPGGLGRGYREAEDRAKAAVRPAEGFDAASVFGLAVGGWFLFLALPLLLLPRLVLFMTQGSEPPKARAYGAHPTGAVPQYDRSHYDALTPLESFLLRTLGIGLLACAALVFFTVVPAYQPPAQARNPTIAVLAILLCVSAVVSWNAPLGVAATLVGFGNGLVGAWGWWVLFFGQETHHFKKYLKEDSRFKRL